MKKLLSVVLTCFCVLFAACGGKQEQKDEDNKVKVKPATTAVSGALSKCFEVVDKEYKLKSDGLFWELRVEFKRTDADTPYQPDDIDSYPERDEATASMLAGFGIEILDEDGDVIGSSSASAAYYSDSETAQVLRLNPGETASIEFTITELDGKPVSFRITSDAQKNTKRKRATSVEAPSDTDIDAALEDVEKAAETVKKTTEAMSGIIDLVK